MTHTWKTGLLAAQLGLATVGYAQTTFHTGVLIYAPVVRDNKPDGLWHSGGYVCTEGSEHYGPDCVPEPTLSDPPDMATLTLDDGKVLHVRGSLAGVAKLEAMTHDHKGTWNVSYEFTGVLQNSLTGHTIQFATVVFPLTIGGKIHPITKHISFDMQDKWSNASTIEDVAQ